MDKSRKFWRREAVVAALFLILGLSAQGSETDAVDTLCAERPASIDDAPVAEVAGFYRVDRDHSKLKFCVSRIPFSEVEGEFGSFAGEFTIPKHSLEATQLRVAIRPESVDTGNKLINSVVTGEQFFGVKEHPEIRFKSTSIQLTGENVARLTGDLTLRGKTRPVSFNVYFVFDPFKPGSTERGVSFEGGFEISRSEFGMDSLTGVVGDKVRICLSARAYRVE